MTREERYKHALKWVNARRREGGLRATSRLSKGYPMDMYQCPIAQSLHCIGVRASLPVDDGVELWGYEYETRTFNEPEVVQFMRDFDREKYPELIVKPKPIKINGEVVLHGD